ncbi:hypothetical protein [Corynebacterium sp.]|uniref:hypothetical protein n=1 Tax=Corynebacterium sp. TaxID=1720 RepID=UPI0026DFE758|nr:hypothetical protein [Corynebacterium sp.]MDO5511934.1 hypothetical protein [Corynebacterium sp.]
MTSPFPTPIVIDPDDAEQYLAQMDVSLEHIVAALNSGGTAAANTDSFHPVNAPGFYFWSETSATLRRSHSTGPEWSCDNKFGRPRISHSSGKYILVAVGGNELTASQQDPNVARRKGPGLEAAQYEQLTIGLPLSGSTSVPDLSGPPFGEWLLLYRADRQGVRAEVSLPSGVSEGLITGWKVRVILPSIKYDGDISLPTDFGGDDVDFYIREA